MTNPVVSVIMPVYNGANTVVATVDCVLAQTFENFEFIIVDDNSTDETRNLLAKFSDPRIQVLHQSQNQGPTRARRAGLEHSKGSLVAYIDSDDLWTKDKLERQVEALKADSTAAVAYSWTDTFTTDPNASRPLCRVEFNGNVLGHLLLGNFLCSGSNMLVKRELLIELEDLTDYGHADDWCAGLMLALHHQFVCVPQVQILYRQSHNSFSTHVFEMEKACLNILAKIYPLAPGELQDQVDTSLSNVYGYLIDKTLAGTQTSIQKELVALRLVLSWLKHVRMKRWPKRALLRTLTSIFCGRLLPEMRKFPRNEPITPSQAETSRSRSTPTNNHRIAHSMTRATSAVQSGSGSTPTNTHRVAISMPAGSSALQCSYGLPVAQATEL